jgi:tetratricopeptide (TPR) repeat protein
MALIVISLFLLLNHHQEKLSQNQIWSEVLKVVNVFISYSEDDGKDLAEKLKRALEGIDTEISAFVAAKDIGVGVSWIEVINGALSDCDVFIPILTVAACRSEWVQREIGAAIEKETKTIPCVYKQVAPNMIPDIIEGLQRITFDNKYDLSRQVLALFLPSRNDQGPKKPEKPELFFPIDKSTKIAEYRKFLEKFMRKFISEKLEEYYGGKWWKQGVPEGIRKKCAVRKEQAIREGRGCEDDPLIIYMDIPDYSEIVCDFGKHWENIFSKYYEGTLITKEGFRVKIHELYPIRKDGDHSREFRISDNDVGRFEMYVLDLLCFENDRTDFRKRIKEHSGERILPPPEFDTAALHEIKDRNILHDVARNSNFLENKEEDFETKRKKIFYFGDDQTIDRLSRDIVDKLCPQKILFITGPPAVGKSTFMLFLLDKCLREGIGEWQKVFFLNPNAEKLKKSLKLIDGIMKKKSDEISPEDVLLVIDALHRKEDEERYMDKCSELFTKILEDRYCLVVTMRDSEMAILKEMLGDRWAEFENIIEEEPVDPKKARIKQIFMNYLNYYKDKIKLQNIDLSFGDINRYIQEGEIVSAEKSESYRELDKCIQKVVEKSEGVPGYVKYLMDDISRKGELSTEIIEKYPAGMTNLIRRIIERDYVIGDDRVLPLLILFLAKEKGHAVTWEFIKSFIEWGVDVIDKSRFDKEMILERARNLINYYAVDVHDGNITQYYLISHWREGVEDILKQRKVQKFTEIESELGDWIEKYLTQKKEELRKREISEILEIWLVVADVAKLSYERKKMEVLTYATQFFIEHRDDTERCAFLKKTLSSLWQEKMDDELSAGECENAAVSLENAIELCIDDASLHSRASDCYYEKGELSKALEHSQRAVEFKPAEPTYLGKHGRILEREGVDLEEEGNYSEAISKFKEAINGGYKKAIGIIEGLSEGEKGVRKREKGLYYWGIGRCNRRIDIIHMKLQHIDKEGFKEKAEQCFMDGKNYETKGDYDAALKMFVDAKELMSKYIEITDIFGVDACNLINNIYRRIGVCYENIGDYEKSTDTNIIYSMLNEYAPDSFEIIMKNGNKFRGWATKYKKMHDFSKAIEMYSKALYCFRKALRASQNNYEILSELADISARLGKFNDAVNYADKALIEQKSVIGFQTESDSQILEQYEYRLKIREDIGNKLISICNVVDLAIDEEGPWRLSKALYEAGMSIGEIYPKNIVDHWKKNNRREIAKIHNEIENIKISCLCRAVKLNSKNREARNELERMTGRSFEEICKEYEKYYTRDLKRKIENPVDALCRIHSTAISTITRLKEVSRDGIKGKLKMVKNKYSSYWGWLGGRINRIYRDKEGKYVNKVSPNVGVKCFELSLKLRERNKRSSNGLGWALLFARKLEEAIKVFKEDLEDINPNNPASITGIGRAYEEKGDYNSAMVYLKKGAKLLSEYRYDNEPQKVIEYLMKSVDELKNLASLCDSRERLEILSEALEIYGMIGEIAQEIKLEDEQNLFKLEAANLEKYISNVEMGVLEGYNV